MNASHNHLDMFSSVVAMDHSSHSSSNASTTPEAAALLNAQRAVKHKRRYCRYLGCTRIVKSQGLCQRHGATPRKCRVSDCTKQAQGNFDGMCKSHFRSYKRETTPLPKHDVTQAQVIPLGIESVYDRILPQSVAWHANLNTPMPLIQHLKHGFDANKPPAWHRNEERQARGMIPVHNAATQLETWERELVWMEILALSGNPDASFRHLARAWGRDKGFHMVLAQFICERRGDVERKKRERQADMPNVWDPDATGYGEVYDEALASDLLQFSQQVGVDQPFISQPKHGVYNQPQHQQEHQVREHRESFDHEEPCYSTSSMDSSADDEHLIKSMHQSSQQHPYQQPQHGNGGQNKDLFPV
ncbi:hypothetical protein MPSEU_000432500 [Mayamaea pseudoterrestris]|nr:hypothetical protein MPSEU_000432500 [Mayamaea pseudoterrestris]